MNLADFATELESRQRASRLAKRSRPWRPSMTPATSLGYECERRIVYQQVNPKEAAPINEELASIFEEGSLHERSVRSELSELGFEIVAQEVNFRDERLQITGTIDGKIRVPDDEARKGFREVPIEIKGMTGATPQTQEQWAASETPLIRRYYDQTQTYMLLTDTPEALGLFKSKITGLWNAVAVSLDLARGEALLQRAERVRDAVAAVRGGDESAWPERIPDRSECPGCPFRDTVCHPAEAPIDPLLLAVDDGLAAELEERESLDKGRKRFKKLDDAIKGRFKLTAGDRFVVGGADGFLVQKKPHGKGIRVDIKRLSPDQQETES